MRTQLAIRLTQVPRVRAPVLTSLVWLASLSVALSAEVASEHVGSELQPNNAVATAPDAAAESPGATSSRTPIRRDGEGAGAKPTRLGAQSVTGTLATLGFILGGLYLALHWLRRRQTASGTTSPDAIDVLASRRLDTHGTLHLVRIGPRVLAIGSGAAGMRTLSVIDDPEEIAGLVASRGAGAASGIRRSGNGRRGTGAGDKADDDLSVMERVAGGLSSSGRAA